MFDHSLGNAPKEESQQSRAPSRAHHDEFGTPLFSNPDNPIGRMAPANDTFCTHSRFRKVVSSSFGYGLCRGETIGARPFAIPAFSFRLGNHGHDDELGA
jgi:hypothetical protein